MTDIVEKTFVARDIEFKDALYDDKFSDEIVKNPLGPSEKEDVDNPGSIYMSNKLRKRLLFRTQARSKNQVNLIRKARESYQKELDKYTKGEDLAKADARNIAQSRQRLISAVGATNRIPALVSGAGGAPPPGP